MDQSTKGKHSFVTYMRVKLIRITTSTRLDHVCAHRHGQ